jgi:hypothetical protein
MAGHQQVGHGGQVHLVGLDAPLAAGPPLPGHMRGVELDELPIGWQHAGGQQRTVVVASCPDPDPDQVDRTFGADCLNPSGELGHPARLIGNSNGRTSSSPVKSPTSAIAWCLPTSIGTASNCSGGSPRVGAVSRCT